MSKSNAPDGAALSSADPSDSPARREFLKASAAAASATLLSACIGGGGGESVPLLEAAPEDPLARFDHLVVVMFENRSFDNILGYLYPADSKFNGLSGGTYSNPVPGNLKDGHDVVYARPNPGTDADMQNPNPDPGEAYPHVNTQIFGTVDPPYNTPPPLAAPTMKGFVEDYCTTFAETKKRDPTFDEYRVIMDSFTPEQLPVLSTLAKSFAVYDAWFCAVPSQTGCNRAFFHASTSNSWVVNAPNAKWPLFNDVPTIFNRLQDKGRSWKVYYDRTQLVSLTFLQHARVLHDYWYTNFAYMEDFYADVANGTLPDYAFIEPRMFIAHNDFHPPAPLTDDGTFSFPSDVRAGDLLVHQIYSAVREGARARDTMLLITFDEHGGCFDHVAPPPAEPPPNVPDHDSMGFDFKRLGIRVPAIAISAYTQEGTIVQRTVHHAAVISTLCRKFHLDALTDRDKGAPDLRDAINIPTGQPARDPSTWPRTVPRPVPPEALNTDVTSAQLAGASLNELGQFIVGMALAYIHGAEPTTEAMPKTVGEAHALLKGQTGVGFGRR